MKKDNELVTIAKGLPQVDAEILASALEAEGIPCLVTNVNDPYTALLGSTIKVFARDEAAAKKILSAE